MEAIRSPLSDLPPYLTELYCAANRHFSEEISNVLVHFEASQALFEADKAAAE